MLDRAFRSALRSFSTLCLVVAAITIPLHLIYGFVFQDVIATRDIHAQISEFPNYRQVHNVGPKDLTTAALAYLGLTVLELALIPLFARATRRVIAVEQAGGVASVPDAWRHAFDGGDGKGAFDPGALPSVAIAAIVAFVLGFLIERAGLVIADALSDEIAWITVGLVQGVARALAAPFLLCALVSARTAKETPLVTPKLY